MPLLTENTTFTRDVQGRYLCNTFDEAKNTDFRRFDIFVLGGGSFGAVIAEQLFQLGARNRHRILVLEGGPFVLPEHIQNLPPLHAILGAPNATTLENLRKLWKEKNNGTEPPALFDRNDIEPGVEIWGLPWHARVGLLAQDPQDKLFPGLAYSVGGRSLFWGGWSPELIDSELAEWPSELKHDLKNKYFKEAKQQLGTDTTNDFIFGDLHTALREQLFSKLGTVTDNVPVNSANELEAPLAVQAAPLRAGFFPFNKFSTVPLIMEAVRNAEKESPRNDYNKRLMIIPNCHIIMLHLDGFKRVNRIQTNLGDVEVSPNSIVIIALGTIESTRLALLSFPNGNGLIGKNLMAHLRSNLNIRVPREALQSLDPNVKELQTSALFVKGRHTHTDGTFGHFHLQITASGLGKKGTQSEAELWKKVPDIDAIEVLSAADDSHVVVTIRGIGEMIGQKGLNAHSRIDLDPELDEHGTKRAIVTLGLTQKDKHLWNAMDQAADDVAKVFAANQQDQLEVLGRNHDGLGTTHHEGGTLWMGEDPGKSVTNLIGRFHEVGNAYAVGPALLPTLGSPNPMLSGIGLARRTARAIIPSDLKPTVETGFTPLFDGSSTVGWQMAGSGQFILEDRIDDQGKSYGVLRSNGGMGLLWYAKKKFKNFILLVDWRLSNPSDNSGVYVRFPNPGIDPWVAVNQGYEIQIDDLGRDKQGKQGNPMYMTGAIYEFAPVSHLASCLPREWNSFEIRVEGQKYTTTLNSEKVTEFTGNRALEGYVGIQNHSENSQVFFRNIRIKELPDL